MISHEAPVTSGFGAEIAATIQEACLLSLCAPIRRVCGWDTHFPLIFEKLYLPNAYRCYDAIKRAISY